MLRHVKAMIGGGLAAALHSRCAALQEACSGFRLPGVQLSSMLSKIWQLGDAMDDAPCGCQVTSCQPALSNCPSHNHGNNTSPAATVTLVVLLGVPQAGQIQR